jgi:hypothetical protein
MTETEQLANLLATSAGVGLLMVMAGVQKRMLQWRFGRRRCPSCGRAARDCSCLANR